MKKENTTISVKKLQQLISGDDKYLGNYLNSINELVDLRDLFEKIKLEEWPRFLNLISNKEKCSEIVSQLKDLQLKKLQSKLELREIANLAKKMESDDAADLIGTLSTLKQIEILKKLPLEDRIEIQELLKYPEDSAGGIMQIERAQVLETSVISDAINKVRELVENDIKVLNVWIVDDQNKLVGYVELVSLLINKLTTPIRNIMNIKPITVQPFLDQEEVVKIFKKYNLITLPVVNREYKLLGSIVIDDIVDVLTEEAEEDAFHMGGTSTEELAHQEEVLQTLYIRLPWLSIAFLSSLISAFLIYHFEVIFKQAPYLFTIIPLISAMSGSTGLQSATVLMRGLTSGKINYNNLPNILFKEARVGILLGILIGIAAAFISILILKPYNYLFGFIVFISMLIAMFTAATLGVIAPSILNKLGIDPAIASGPFLQTTLDITGILIFLGTTTIFLQQLN